MQKLNSLSLLLAFVLFSCKTATPVITAKTNLEELTMMQGEKEQPVWINKSLVVGIMMPGMDSVYRILDEQGLMWDTARVLRTRLGLYAGGARNFSFFRKVDGKSINQEDSQELEALRTTYHRSFGPGLYRENGIIYGLLTNIIMVDIERRTPKERIQEIMETYQATRIYRQHDNVYYVEFPKAWGYKVIDVAKELMNYEEVKAVNHQTEVIRSHG